MSNQQIDHRDRERSLALDPVAGHQPADPALGDTEGAGHIGLGRAGKDGGDDKATFRHRVASARGRGACRAMPMTRDIPIPISRDTPFRCPGPGHCQPDAEFPQVIPEGAGPVKSVGRPFFLPSTRPVGAPMRRRGQGSGGARPRSGRRALRPSPFGACCVGCRGSGWVLLGVRGLVDVARIRAGCVPVGSRPGGLLGHPFAALVPVSRSAGGGMMGCAASGRSGSIRTRDLAADVLVRGGHDLHDPRPTGVCGGGSHAASR